MDNVNEKELTGTIYTDAYGYIGNRLQVSNPKDNFDYYCRIDVKRIVFTESQVRDLGYEPQEFVKLINSPKGESITFQAEYGSGVTDKSFESQGTYSLSSFDIVQVMFDKWPSLSLAYEENKEKMNKYADIIIRHIDELEKEIDEKMQNNLD